MSNRAAMIGRRTSSRRMSSRRLAVPGVGTALDVVGEGGVVGAEVLGGARVDVADDRAPGAVQRGNGVRAGLHAVDVVDLGVDARVDRGRELPLPGGARR